MKRTLQLGFSFFGGAALLASGSLGLAVARAESDRSEVYCYGHRGLAHRVIAVGRRARYATGGGGGGFGGLGGGGFGGFDGSMGQRIPGLSPAVAEEMVTHAYLCVGAVGVFFNFVTDCFIASCVPSTSPFPAPDPAPFAEILSVGAKYIEPDDN